MLVHIVLVNCYGVYVLIHSAMVYLCTVLWCAVYWCTDRAIVCATFVHSAMVCGVLVHGAMVCGLIAYSHGV